jgi:hypothetical protein
MIEVRVAGYFVGIVTSRGCSAFFDGSAHATSYLDPIGFTATVLFHNWPSPLIVLLETPLARSIVLHMGFISDATSSIQAVDQLDVCTLRRIQLFKLSQLFPQGLQSFLSLLNLIRVPNPDLNSPLLHL